ncbi:MAG: phage portal protein [Caulobacteraceae bacterium]|nr:phage portal protein [Caulobacteraceae bacterium]
MKGLFETMAAGLPRGLEAKSTDIGALTWGEIFGLPSSKAGVAVNVDTALRVTTVLACVRVCGEGVAQLPLIVGRIDPDTDAFVPAKGDPLYRMLHRRPNDWMTSFELRETMMVHAALCGDGFALKNVLRGQVRELLPVPRGYITPERRPNWGMIYHVNDPYGAVGTFTRKDFLHIRGPSWDSFLGLDAVREAREAIGLAIATEEAHERLYANGGRPGGILTTESKLGDEARERLKKAFGESHGGVAQWFKTLVLDNGMKWQPMAMSGVDAQHLETRRFQIEEICRAFRVFPHMVGYSDKTATFASAESFFQGHVLHTLMPWLERWEQALDRDVMPADGTLCVRFDYRQLIRGDTAARAQFYTSGITNGWLTRNDARRMESLAPLPGLDDPLTPLNMGSTHNAALMAEGPQAAKAIARVAEAEIRSWVGHNGGPPLDDDQADEFKARLAQRICDVLRVERPAEI